MTELERLPFHRSLHRPRLVLGGERIPVILTGILSAALVATDISIFKIILAIVFWSAFIALFRLFAQHDSQMVQVYLRRYPYKKYYPAMDRVFK